MKKEKTADFIKFLGTAGARFVMIEQLRASGGIWVSCRGTHILIDPGPGSIVRCAASRPRLDPCALDGIILTHRHLDHCGDINVMIEAMTRGGSEKRGVVFCPDDALKPDPVILRHALNFPREIRRLKANSSYRAGEFQFRTSMRHIHPAKTFGIKFTLNKKSVSFLADTQYFPRLADFYATDILIICVVFYQPRQGIQHLCLEEAEEIIRRVKPEKTILTHFGMTMLKAKPRLQAERLSKKLGRQVIAAYDGMSLYF